MMNEYLLDLARTLCKRFTDDDAVAEVVRAEITRQCGPHAVAVTDEDVRVAIRKVRQEQFQIVRTGNRLKRLFG